MGGSRTYKSRYYGELPDSGRKYTTASSPTPLDISREYTTASTMPTPLNSSSVDHEAIAEIMAKLGELRKPDFDSCVMVYATYNKLKEAAPDGSINADRIYGIPIYVFSTLRECLDKMLELPKAMLVYDGDIPVDLLFHPYFKKLVGSLPTEYKMEPTMFVDPKLSS